MTRSRSDRLQTGGAALLLCVPFVLFCAHYWAFTIDDAFIAFRYARHLAEHGTLAWNLGQDPVEGFTSALWVVLNAGAIALGISPLAFSKGLSFAAGLIMIGGLVWAGRSRPWPLQLGLPAALALSPAVAVLTVQGLETMLAALLVLATGALSVRLVRTPSGRGAALWYGCAFVGGLVRPDTLVFSAGAFGALVVLLSRTDRAALRSLLLTSLPFLVLGGAYMGWRVWYFGHWLPNPAYLKGDSLGGGIKYTATFLSHLLAPYLVVGLLAATQGEDESLIEIGPPLAGAGLFGLYLLNVEPIQGFLWRYALPVLPVLLYAILQLPWDVEPAGRTGHLGRWALGGLLLLFPLHTYPDARTNIEPRPSHDRVAVGTALQGLDGRLFTSESGALAYYSEWTVLDLLGLNSEQIAHGQPRRAALRAFAPDVIGLLARDAPIATTHRHWQITLPYIQSEGYVAVAATRKTATTHHLYFVDPASPLCEAVVPRLRSISSVSYTPMPTLLPDSLDVPVAPAPPAPAVEATCTTP